MARAKTKQSLEDKVRSNNPGLVDAAGSMSVYELRTAIVKRALLYSQSKAAEKADVDLKQAKDEAKALAQPYRDDQKAAQQAIDYLGELLELRGGK